MNRFAELLARLAYEPGRNNKLRLMTDYFRHTSDPERGFALASLTGNLVFQHAKPGMIRALITERTDPVLFGLSRDFVGDTSETIALMWPAPEKRPNFIPSITDVVTTLNTLGKAELPAQIARWLDALDETGRWALLKLVTGAMMPLSLVPRCSRVRSWMAPMLSTAHWSCRLMSCSPMPR